MRVMASRVPAATCGRSLIQPPPSAPASDITARSCASRTEIQGLPGREQRPLRAFEHRGTSIVLRELPLVSAYAPAAAATTASSLQHHPLWRRFCFDRDQRTRRR